MWRNWSTLAMTCGLALLVFSRSPAVLSAQEPDGLAVVSAIEQAFVEAIARAEQSVVSIARVKLSPAQIAISERMPRDQIFNPRRERYADPDDPSDPNYIPTDFGSGVVIGTDVTHGGERRTLILTNYHVVKGGQRLLPDENFPPEYLLYVRLPNRRGVEARILAADPRSDLAVVAIPETDIKPIPLGDGSRLRKGQLVIALGNPYAAARDGSVSAGWGIISNLRRRPGTLRDRTENRKTLQELGDLIQVDIRLNLGMSGGALVNIRGELIGLTTSLAALSGYEKSSGYAVPLDASTQRIIQTLREGKEVEYGFLGVSFQGPASLDGRTDLNAFRPSTEPPEGVQVVSVLADGPAAAAGIQSDDVILSINGERVYNQDDLMRIVNKQGPDSRIPITVWRLNRGEGESVNLEVVLTKWGASDEDSIIVSEWRYPPWRGLVVDYSGAREKHNSLMSEQNRYPAGVLVLKILPPFDTAYKDLVEGNRITRVNQKPVSTPAEFYEAVKDLRGDVSLELLNDKDVNARDKMTFRRITIQE